MRRCKLAQDAQVLAYTFHFEAQESKCRGARDGESGVANFRLASHMSDSLSVNHKRYWRLALGLRYRWTGLFETDEQNQ